MSGKFNIELGTWSPAQSGQHPPTKIIIKVQMSLMTSESNQQLLVYNKDRSIYMQGDAGKDIAEVMAGRPKVFFEATLTNGLIEVGKEVPDPGW